MNSVVTDAVTLPVPTRQLRPARVALLRVLPSALKSDGAEAVDTSSLEPRNRSVRASGETSILTTSWACQDGIRGFGPLPIGLAVILNTTERPTLDARQAAGLKASP